MRTIAEHIARASREARDLVLVTIMESKGSTPRHAGSQMLVDENGLVCGTIGGGAVEAHAIKKARDMLGENLSLVENMELKLASKKGLDMACGGDATLLYTPVNASDTHWRDAAREMLRCIDQRIPSYLVVKCSEGGQSSESTVALLDANGAPLAGERGMQASLIAGLERRAVIDGRFVMPVSLPARAIVFGGGHVGRATVSALSRVGFCCTLFDCRPEFAQHSRVPEAHDVILGDYDNIAASLTLDEHDFVIIMTHTHRSDYALLEQVLRRPLAYVGLMGSRRKIATGRELMLNAGIPQEAIDAVHMPIGLDIAAETPEEIAVSVAAECTMRRAEMRRGTGESQ